MSSELAVAIDPFDASKDHLLVVIFGKSSSPVYSLAIAVAKSAAKYAEISLDNKPFSLVAFGKTEEDAKRAATLINFVSGWKATQIFAKGKLVSQIWEAKRVIECFLNATCCKDRSAHCFRVIDDPLNPQAQSEHQSFSISIDLNSRQGFLRKNRHRPIHFSV